MWRLAGSNSASLYRLTTTTTSPSATALHRLNIHPQMAFRGGSKRMPTRIPHSQQWRHGHYGPTATTTPSLASWWFKNKIARWYRRQLRERPLLTSCLSGGMIVGVSDAMFQYNKSGNTSFFGWKEWNYKRTLGLAMAQAFFITPARCLCYKLYASEGSLIRGSLSRALWHTWSACSICQPFGFLFHYYLLDKKYDINHDVNIMLDEEEHDDVPMLIWYPSELFNFWFIPNFVNFFMVRSRYHLLFASIVSAYWNEHLAEMLQDEMFSGNEMMRGTLKAAARDLNPKES